jgi:hypothetical protein
MTTLTRKSLAQAAAVAAMCVVASSIAWQTATAKIEARHPDMAVSQAFEVLEQSGQYAPARHTTGARKGDLQVDNCKGQAWPYISNACVIGHNPARQVSRTITIEQRTGEASSALIRVSADQQMASR